ncbi:MAG: OmpA family protein [Candidatus Zixiibacteriota bacterium]|nr:MAG: OmpA family protein [candidate division Zixibacteria bacterium]
MKRNATILIATLAVLALSWQANAQFKDLGAELGLYGGGPLGLNENSIGDNDWQALLRGSLAFPLTDRLQLELGGGWARNGEAHGPQAFETNLIPLDLRLRFSLVNLTRWFPYLYAGGGAVHYQVNQDMLPAGSDPEHTEEGWTGLIPFGAGVQFRLSSVVSLDLNAGSNYTFTDYINPRTGKNNDSYFTLAGGLRFALKESNTDADLDRLLRRDERRYGTNPKNPDTDGDGLKDGDEVLTYKTDPLKPDSDGDGLTDGDEVLTHKTGPTMADSDTEGLTDGEEVLKYKTNPLKPDTDGDGLSDNEEVSTRKTDPLMADTDGDGLSDGQEVMEHQSDPLAKDTDGGSVDDYAEVYRGSNPRLASDDVPRPPMEKGQAITLEGITFRTGSAEILPESEAILGWAYDTMDHFPQIEVEICGHTDNTGSKTTNQKLSQARAEAVKAWLTAKGIAGERIRTRGCGPDHPVADNATSEGRQKNRRIEFVRVDNME